MIKLAIVDDDARLLRHLNNAFQGSPDISFVLLFNSGVEFVEKLTTMSPADRPDVIIMDISMGSANEGIVTTGRIKTLFPDIQVIMFTVLDDDARIFEAFKAGAMGYLLKDESPEYILKTVLDVRNGGAQMSPVIAKKAIQFMASQHVPVVEEKETNEGLTPRELEIMQMTADGFSYNEIAEKLSIATSTVKKHMTNVFQKLQVKNKILAINKIKAMR
jgi:DNA-binding NarL/FixJ family response regulator